MESVLLFTKAIKSKNYKSLITVFLCTLTASCKLTSPEVLPVSEEREESFHCSDSTSGNKINN